MSNHVSTSDKATAAGIINTLEAAAMSAARAAALAAQHWVGRGDGNAADEAATQAMREVLSGAHGTGSVVIGEGEKDEAPMLYNGEQLGTGEGPEFDIAVDPIEGTSFCAKGLPGALATIAFAESGCMWSPGPAFYMDKLVVPPAARGAVDIDDEPERTLEKVGEAIGKPVEELRVVVLDKPRHEELIERLMKAGASVHAPPDGDVAGALDVLLPGGEADLLMGIGGTPEGAMTACAARALGGGMLGRLAPQKEEEQKELEASDFDLERVYDQDELVSSDSIFVGTGISGGSLLRRPWGSDGAIFTESILITRGTVRRITEMSSEPVPGLSSPRAHVAEDE
ncbi:MAG: class II fructose-bisphosphatase [Actinomycetota bacterium]|nr:class II fructose-bisphosphatase [Actinomycetota bacterium]